MEPWSPVLKVLNSNHWAAREFPLSQINPASSERCECIDSNTENQNPWRWDPGICISPASQVVQRPGELNDVNVLLKLVKQSGMITILSETTIYNGEGFKSIPIDLKIKEMEGCIHVKKNVYQKRSAKEFIRMLGESNAVRERMRECMK